MFSITDKVVIITGGVSGIGLEATKHFIAQGAKVTVADLEDKNKVAEEIGADFIVADVSKLDDMEKLVASVNDKYGRLDVMINNAAIQPLFTPITETSDELLDSVLNTNIKGVFNGTKVAAKYMAGKGGSIINLASWLGQRTSVGMSSYSASKAAIVHFTRTAALEFGPHQVRVNAICPGLFMTPAMDDNSKPVWEFMAPLGRTGKLEELAQLMHFLSSDAAGYITGDAITIDGGMSAGYSQNTFGAVISALQQTQ